MTTTELTKGDITKMIKKLKRDRAALTADLERTQKAITKIDSELIRYKTMEERKV